MQSEQDADQPAETETVDLAFADAVHAINLARNQEPSTDTSLLYDRVCRPHVRSAAHLRAAVDSMLADPKDGRYPTPAALVEHLTATAPRDEGTPTRLLAASEQRAPQWDLHWQIHVDGVVRAHPMLPGEGALHYVDRICVLSGLIAPEASAFPENKTLEPWREAAPKTDWRMPHKNE